MNFKLVAIYTILYFSLGVLLGIPEGFWASSTGEVHVFSSKSYFWGKLLVWIAIDIMFFSHLFKRNPPNPIIASAIIVVLAWAIDSGLVYFLAAITPAALLVAIDFVGSSIAILIAYCLRYKILERPRSA